jgi:Protein of unknown function (DUF3795)
MEQNLGKCGIDCNECNAYKATIKNSDELRKKTAEEWSKMFGVNIDPAGINCDGCQNDKKLFSHCKVCGIRRCASEKGFKTCAECPDYGCELVAGIWSHDKNIKKNLDQLRA